MNLSLHSPCLKQPVCSLQTNKKSTCSTRLRQQKRKSKVYNSKYWQHPNATRFQALRKMPKNSWRFWRVLRKLFTPNANRSPFWPQQSTRATFMLTDGFWVNRISMTWLKNTTKGISGTTTSPTVPLISLSSMETNASCAEILNLSSTYWPENAPIVLKTNNQTLTSGNVLIGLIILILPPCRTGLKKGLRCLFQQNNCFLVHPKSLTTTARNVKCVWCPDTGVSKRTHA